MVWFRRDLRINDNTALATACKDANEGVVAVFYITPAQWIEHHDAPLKVDFWLRNVAALSESLAELNIPLLVQRCKRFSDLSLIHI